MDRKVEIIKRPLPEPARAVRAVAYARVSSGKDEMLHSLAAQVSYYNELIQRRPGWVLAKAYSDEARSGTKDTRPGFVRLVNDCREGKIDTIITKSISRFARNTVTLLNTVRELKLLGIDVYFEEQNLHTIGADGELMLTILASFAEAEALSASENQKWRIRKNFEEGKPWKGEVIGYRMDHGQYVIVPDEAKIVRRIFKEYLAGDGTGMIAKRLNEEGVLTMYGYQWRTNAVARILKNVTYTGDLVLQRFYSENYITKRKTANRGELPKYIVEDAHEPIIGREDFDAVQIEIQKRNEKFGPKTHEKKQYPYTGRIVCAVCGKNYRRKTARGKAIWCCSTYNTAGKKYCSSKAIPESCLNEMTAGMDLSQISSISAEPGNRIVIKTADGDSLERTWQDRSRSESWTPEMRAAAGNRTKERNQKNAEC